MDDNVIDIPQPERTTYNKVNMATEIAFTELVKQAKALGLPVNPVMGLMYLPDQAATRAFQQGCRAALRSLGVAIDL